MKQLIEALKKEGIVNKGNFTLTSGELSDYYFDVKKAIGNPELLEMMSSLLAAEIGDKATCIASFGFGGIPLATAVSLKLRLPLIMVRNSAKGYGLEKVVEGYIPSSKDKVAVIDDVFTMGTSMLKIVKALSMTRAKILAGYVIVRRGDISKLKIPIKSLLTMKDLTYK